jgi:hypothetical protein
MDPLVQITLQSLATHYRVDPNQLIDLLLAREVLTLQSLTDHKAPDSLPELHKVLDKRDAKVSELCQVLLAKAADLDAQAATAKGLLGEIQRMCAHLRIKYPQVLPTEQPAG